MRRGVFLADRIIDELNRAKGDKTYAQIAIHTCINENTITRYMNGASDIPLSKLIDLCDYLGYDVIVKRKEMPKQ